MRVYVRESSVARSLRLRSLTSHLVTEQDYFTQLRLTALFIHLTLNRCAELGVTPYTANGEVDLSEILSDAETQLGLYFTDDEMLMMSEKDRRKVTERKLFRRRYAYSVFIRFVSGGVIPQ